MKKTNIKSNEKFNLSSHERFQVCLNTDETGIVEVLIPMFGQNFVRVQLLAEYEELKEAMIRSGEIEQPKELEVKQEEQNKVSEDFALKMAAIVINKENYKEVK
jgi:hypothetical protein